MAGFRSLRERRAGPPDPDEVLPLDVLPHMRQPLVDWLTSSCQYQAELWSVLCRMLKIDYTSAYPHDAIIKRANADNDILLDLVDARLKVGNVASNVGAYLDVRELEMTLALAGSGWRVNDSRDGLEQVVDEAVRATAQAAIATADASAATHLAKAWSETFGKDKNPAHAHAEMIKAVESAAIPVVTPNNTKATLGTLIGQLAAQGSRYTTSGESAANDGVEAVVAMMKVVWQQQTDRHGANPTIPATQDRVEFLLPIAAALVHAFSNGHVRALDAAGAQMVDPAAARSWRRRSP